MAALAVNPFARRSIGFLAVLAVAGVALSSCNDGTSALRRMARVTLQPQFTRRDAEIYSALPTFNLSVSTIHLVLKRPNSTDVVKDTTVAVAEGQDSVLITLNVPILGNQETFIASLEMLSGNIVIFSGSVSVVAKTGASFDAPPVLVPVWVGPGKEATKIVIAPRDPTIPAQNGRITFTATALDANNQPVIDPEFLSRWKWNVNDPTLGTIPVGGGDFVAAGKTGTALVSVFTPNLLRDTVRVTLVAQLPLAKVAFARQIEVVDRSATTTVPITTTDANGKAITGATTSYTSRSSAIATVSSSGVITGIAKGQAIILVQASDPGSATVFRDSLLAVVAEPGAPLLISSIDKFEYGTNATLTVSVFVDMRSSTKKVGSTTIDVSWDPANLIYQSIANGASGVLPTTNSSLTSTGKLTFAMADVAGFGGKIEMLKITFKTSASASLGQLALSAREMTASDLSTDLLPLLAQVTQPLSIH